MGSESGPGGCTMKRNDGQIRSSAAEVARFKAQNDRLRGRIRELEIFAAEQCARADYYRTVADFTHDWEYWIGPDGRFLYVSPSCERFTGYPPDAFVADPDLFRRIVHPDDRETLLVHVTGEVSEGVHPPMEFRIITRAGDLRWISHTCRPVFDGEGRFLGRRGNNRDATGRKAAEEALSLSEIRYRTMFDGINSCVAVCEPVEEGTDFIFTDFNPAAERSSRLTREAVMGRRVTEVFPSVAESGLLDLFRRVHRTGEPERLPLSRYRDRRIELWVENHVYRLPTGEIVAVYDDRTAEKRAEEGLKRSEERLNQALDATSDGLWDWDVPSGRAYFSPRYFTMLGYEPDAFPSTFASWDSLLHPDDRREAQAIIRDHMERGVPYNVEFRLRNKSGHWQWILGRGRIVERDDAGRPRRMVGTHVDIHERKGMTEQLRRHIKELETLNDLSRSAALGLSMAEVTEAALDRLLKPLSPDLAVLYLMSDGELIRQSVRTGISGFNTAEETRHPVGECLCGLAAQENQPLFSVDIHEDDRCTCRECKDAGIRSVVSLPLSSRGRMIGVLALGSKGERDFSLRASFLQSLAAMVSTGIDNARLHQRVRAHAEELEATVARRTAELKKFQNAVDHSPASIVITDPEGTIEYVNPFFTRLTGYTPAEARGRNPRILNSGHHDDAFFEDLWTTLLSKRTWRGEILNRKKDGSLYWESASISPLLSDDGETTHFVAVKEDITAKKAAEKALQESETRYRTIFHASRDGILIADQATRRFHYANDAACRMLGYSRQELLSRSLTDIHPEADRDMVLTAFNRLAAGEIDFLSELPCRCRDGRVFYCDISAAPVSIDGRPCVLGFFRDVTERIEAARLREEVDRIMRHDLRSPLNGIIGVPQLMMSDENLTAGQRKLLQMLTDSAHKMLGLINLSSTLYQIEQGVYEPAWGAFDLLQLLKRCMADNRSLSRAKSIDLHLLTAGFEPPDPEKVIVHGEELLTYSIFSNLVVNAVEASPEGNRVAVRIQRGRGIRVEIHNQGAVPATVRQRFFDKYVTFGKEKGTGLGTYSAKLLAEVQGWSISMVTSREEGTVVRVAIPV